MESTASAACAPDSIPALLAKKRYLNAEQIHVTLLERNQMDV
jgi:hypothetical protein